MSKLSLDHCRGDDGTVYFARGDFTDDEFRAALLKKLGADDPLMDMPVQRGFMRYTPDPNHEYPVMLEFGVAQKRGAWRATWVDSDS